MESAANRTSQEHPRSPPAIKLAILVVVIAAVLVAGYFLDIQSKLKRGLDWIEGSGPIGFVVFFVLYILACVFLVPGTILTLFAGATWGLGWGFIIASISSTTGAAAAFVVGRYFARDWVANKVADNVRFEAIDDAVAREGWKIVALTRLSPVFPFNLQNYAYGLTKVSLIHYVLASWIGMIPGTVMYVYLGTVAGQAAKGENAPGQWVLTTIGLVATVLVTVLITRIARRALQTKVEEEG